MSTVGKKERLTLTKLLMCLVLSVVPLLSIGVVKRCSRTCRVRRTISTRNNGKGNIFS